MINKIHLVSHTHWDREWYLTFQQFRLKLVHLIDRLLDILDSDPDFKYFLLDGQTVLIEDYLQMRPERKLDLIRYIKSGRILIGPWYVSPDEFLISPESLVRNLLEGDQLCRDFGGRMAVGYLPDTFGHIGQMPQILRGFDIDAACVWRGLDDQPSELMWNAPDGSRVLLSYLRNSYSNAASLNTSNIDQFIAEVNEQSHSLASSSRTDQILLMLGTDHMEPPAGLSQAIAAYQNEAAHDDLIHSNLPIYFNAIRSNTTLSGGLFANVTGELRMSRHAPLLPNVLSTRIWIKQRNHKAEIDLLKWVEPLNAWLSKLNLPQDKYSSTTDQKQEPVTNQRSTIRYAWKLLMQCHPHDSICGTSIDQVATEMRVRFDQVDQINQVLIDQLLSTLGDQIDTRSRSIINAEEQHRILSTIVVFNPNDAPQTGLVQMNIRFEDNFPSFDIVSDDGKVLAFDHTGMDVRELISVTFDKKSMKQALSMIHEGTVAGMAIKDALITSTGNQAFIKVTLSDHGIADKQKWQIAVDQLNKEIANPAVNEYVIHAFSDPETELSLVVDGVPAHGYRCYWIRGNPDQGAMISGLRKLNPLLKVLMPLISKISRIPIIPHLYPGKVQKSTSAMRSIENDYLKVEVMPSEGLLSITDKQNGEVYSGVNQFIDGGDCGDLYNYCPPEHDKKLSAQVTKVECYAQDTHQRLIIHYEMKIPAKITDDRKSRSSEMMDIPIVSELTLVNGVPRIDIHTEITNRACDHRLRVHFPSTFASTHSFHDGHYETVQRPIGIPPYDNSWEEPPRPEVPQCQFTSVMNDKASLTIANRGLPEAEVFINERGNAEIAITLLRCVGWLSRDDLTTRKGHAGPMGIAVPDAQMIGTFEFGYSIIPGDGDLLQATQQAYAFNAPLKSISTPIHSGILPARLSIIENHNPNFIITAIKTPQDGSGIIVRGFNRLPSTIDVMIKPWRLFKIAEIVTLGEKPIHSLPITSDGQIAFQLDSYKITTLRIAD